jgi:SAM-dependent methyltransferase
MLPHGELVGIDVSTPVIPDSRTSIRFTAANVVEFEVGKRFDVVFSDNVLEHIAPADLGAHLRSLHKALRPGGQLILLTPNRNFGPSDVTRIIDYTYSNRVPAQGTHLNESSFTELLPVLQQYGFGEFRTVVPVPKLKHLVPLRISPGWLKAVERSRFLLWLLHRLKWHSRCVMRLDVILLCRALTPSR